MVPTEEARITFQMPYSAVPPIGIASARLAMRPPMNFDLLPIVCLWWIAHRSEAMRHTLPDVSFPFPPVTRLWRASQTCSGGRALERHRSYTGRRSLSRNDLARIWDVRTWTASTTHYIVLPPEPGERSLEDKPHS